MYTAHQLGLSVVEYVHLRDRTRAGVQSIKGSS